MVDAVRDRLADGDDHAGHGRELPSHVGEELVARAPTRLEAHVDLGGVHVLRVLVELGAAGAPRRRGDLGDAEQDLLEAAAEPVRLGERRPRQRHGADG